FGLLAYPADYGNSGVMTLIVNHAGQVYQKNLGEETEERAQELIAFDPDKTWKKVDAAND
ncbi:MAG: DUF2950 family protein, partial [Bradyrhizobium sp.]|uniref:DUF2950 family protein n=1 Tax=Bradyrhizobium sp. TaxID=376 RepID=UPI003C7C8462